MKASILFHQTLPSSSYVAYMSPFLAVRHGVISKTGNVGIMLDTLDFLRITIWFFVIATPPTPWLLRLRFHLMRHGARKPFTEGVLRCPVQQKSDIWSANEQGGCYQGCMLPKWLFRQLLCLFCTPKLAWWVCVHLTGFEQLPQHKNSSIHVWPREVNLGCLKLQCMHRIPSSWCKFEGLAKHRRNSGHTHISGEI